MRRLVTPPLGRPEIQAWVASELVGLFAADPSADASADSSSQGAATSVMASDAMGGQTAADAALAAFDVTGYAARRNEVWPRGRQGASRLSPYIRHGLISLPQAWAHVGGGPPADVVRFRDELMWQEYARHLYARVGAASMLDLRFRIAQGTPAGDSDHAAARHAVDPWQTKARCVHDAWRELRERGWITNQQRMWLASHWTVRHGWPWRAGEEWFFRHLLDGSRAANRLGWQWTVGALTGKPYGFSRWQVEKRAPGLCAGCALRDACPIGDWPSVDDPTPLTSLGRELGARADLGRDVDPARTAGPLHAEGGGEPEAVWLTAESLGDGDPALAAHPDLPVLFVFDAPLLRTLRLSPQRLVFLAETLADLAQRRSLAIWRGRPADVLAGIPLATTFAPVPGWRRIARSVELARVHPWPWLRRPTGQPVTSFTGWSRARS